MSHHVLIDGQWRASVGTQTFQAINPATRGTIERQFPVSPWSEIEAAINAADAAFRQTSGWSGDRFAEFLEQYAAGIESRADLLIATANEETALPVEPRLKTAELPRTIGQLRQAAAAAREGSWRLATIDTAANIRSMLAPIGPVVVFGPNNFPFAFNSIAGGDFAAAIAAGNPVIAKGHSSHPETTRLFAEAAQHAAEATGLPAGFVQLIYRCSHEDGAKLVAHPKVGSCGYTGARHAGLYLKEAADKSGKPIYLELSSINPVCILPGALDERLTALVDEFAGSCLMGAGQFCTNPGLVLLIKGGAADQFIDQVAVKFQAATPGTLLGPGVEQSLRAGIVALQRAGAEVVVGNQPGDPQRCCHANTLLKVSGAAFLENPHGLQEEAFGNCSLCVVADDVAQCVEILNHFEGNLTGCIYSDTQGSDDAAYAAIEPVLRRKVGRLLNDKMPTGVAVSPAMNHGGPFPATGHPGFTAVGIPASLRRFAMLQCYDGVRQDRLPGELGDRNPTGKLWRSIDGAWTQGDVSR
ncbi:MAG: aldehyde dehydrogenase (NADP(+)) [Planctomycetaceae bacterium]